MKKSSLFLKASMLALGAAVILSSCNSSSVETVKSNTADTAQAQTTAENTAVSPEAKAICIWDKASLVDKPEKAGKWLSSVSLGESVVFLNESTEETSDKKRTFHKVRLSDGKEGWVQGEFVVPNATGAAVTETCAIYSRPNLTSVSKNSFEPFDIIAVLSEKDGWIEVIGKRRAGTWIDKGFIKHKAYSQSEKDIAVAIYVSRALAKSKTEEKVAELQKIQNNADLSGSSFDVQIGDLLDQLNPNTNTPYTSEGMIFDTTMAGE
jgi:hypothetical protein